MDLQLQGKVAVITGGATGIGRACAEGFLREGCRVAVCSRSQNKLEAIRTHFASYGDAFLAGQADAADSDSIAAFAASAARLGGGTPGIDIWINNAGIFPGGPVLEMSDKDWDNLMRVNVSSVIRGSRAALPWLKARGGGVIINAASLAASNPSVGTGPYAATKAAIASLTRVLAAELAPDGVRVLAYAPGLTRTGMTTWYIESRGEAILDEIPLRRPAEPEEIAGPIIFMASPQASYMTGSSIAINGGTGSVRNAASAWQNRKNG